MIKPSLLERVARAIEPPRPEGVSSVARRIKPLKEIKEAEAVFRPGQRPMPTNGLVRSLDGELKVFFTDGSLRNAKRKLTKEERRQRKRSKRR